jgi:hypothetical protein
MMPAARLLLAASVLAAPLTLHAAEPFAIRVVDEATGRGVPLVELRSTDQQVFVTDSAGICAITDPALLGQKVYFSTFSHGYEKPADGFGFRGIALDLALGGEATIRLQRLNIAERMYRTTGVGIYSDSVELGLEVPLEQPLVSGLVAGQDSVQAAVLGDRVYWFYGDTNRLAYPLGQFRTSGAVSRLPSAGGLSPDEGVDLEYFVDEGGFSRPMFEARGEGVIWLDGVTTLDDGEEGERIVGHFSRRRGLAEELEQGIAVFDPVAGKFEVIATLQDTRHLLGQAVHVGSGDQEYIYLASPYPSLRVPARWEAVIDPEQYEGLTPLVAGTSFDRDQSQIERDADGRVVYDWKLDTPPLTTEQERQLIQSGLLPADSARWQTVDAATGERIRLHGGSVRWNKCRQRWVMIAVEIYGKTSHLGEVWYLEAAEPEGPWTKGVRIVTHDKYSFYNPTHHDFFDEDGGRIIYFEGTHTHTFSGNPVQTPKYDYNQIMYRLDLDDPRLAPARVP